jgi:hypothetical protein
MGEITRQTVAEKVAAYLRHDISRGDLVAWAESAMMEGEFEREHFADIRDVRTFGLAWEDCEQLLSRLGYAARVNIVAT